MVSVPSDRRERREVVTPKSLIEIRLLRDLLRRGTVVPADYCPLWWSLGSFRYPRYFVGGGRQSFTGSVLVTSDLNVLW